MKFNCQRHSYLCGIADGRRGPSEDHSLGAALGIGDLEASDGVLVLLLVHLDMQDVRVVIRKLKYRAPTGKGSMYRNRKFVK